MWKTVKLGDICDFQGGSQPPKKEFIFEERDGYVRFIQIRDFKSDKNVTYIPTTKKNKLCRIDDILIGRYGASVGQILTGLEGAYNVALMKTIPNEERVTKGWLKAYLTSPLFQKPLMEVSKRSAQNGFSKEDIFDIKFPLPPLAEQQRIVAKLDAAFAEIERATQATEANAKNAEALFQSYLTEVFECGGEDEKITLADVLEKTRNVSPEKSPHVEFKYVDVSSVSNITYAIENTQNLLGKDAPSRAKKHIKENDILFATVRPTLKRIAIVPSSLDNQVASTGYVVLRANNKVRYNYIYYYLFSNLFMEAMETLQRGASYPAVTDGDVKNQLIYVPDLVKQDAICLKLDMLMVHKRTLSNCFEIKIKNLSLFKQSILQQALKGELVKE